MGAIRRRKWLFLVPLVILPALMLVATLRQEPVYEAAADVLLERQGAVTTSLIGQTPVVDDVGRTMETQAQLARSDVVLERTIETAESELSTHVLLNTSAVFPLADVLRFVTRGDSADTASRLASAYAREFARFRRELDSQNLARTLRPIREQLEQLEAEGAVQSPSYLQLADRARQLESLSALRASSVTIIGTPDAGDAEQIAPRPRRNVALAFAAGLVLSLVLVFLAESLTTRPRTDDELEELLGVSLLARIGGARAGSDDAGSPPLRTDAIHTLRARLELANARIGARTIMVASPRAESGRTPALLDLALAYARAGRKVAVVDLDFRTPTLTGLLGLDAQVGLANVLAGEADLAEAIVPLSASSVSATAGANGRASLDPQILAVAAGKASGHPAELLSSTALASVLDRLEESADIVLADAPPILEAPDASAVAPRIDAVLLVVGRASMDGPTLVETSRLVELWPATTLGFAVAEDRGSSPSVSGIRWARFEQGVPGLEREGVS